MKLIADIEMQCWLTNFDPEPDNFDWDSGNKNKNHKHGVEWQEIESIFSNEYIFEGKIIEPEHAENRYLLLGTDWKDRDLALIFTTRSEKIRPISCRKMRQKEQKRYETYKTNSH